MDILKNAIETAKKVNISTLVIASTTGNTARNLLGLLKTEKLKMIVVTHDEGRALGERRFNEDIRRELLANNITVYTHDPRWILLRKVFGKILGKLGLPPWHRHLKEVKEKYGTGIKVCHIIVQMLMEGNVLKDDRVVAIAGTKSGADSAGIFLIRPENKWPVLEKVIRDGSQAKVELSPNRDTSRLS